MTAGTFAMRSATTPHCSRVARGMMSNTWRIACTCEPMIRRSPSLPRRALVSTDLQPIRHHGRGVAVGVLFHRHLSDLFEVGPVQLGSGADPVRGR
jgi:hypothetical protein